MQPVHGQAPSIFGRHPFLFLPAWHCLPGLTQECLVLTWAIILAIVSLIAGWLGFGTLSGVAAAIAKVLFVIFVVLFVLALLGVLGVVAIL